MCYAWAVSGPAVGQTTTEGRDARPGPGSHKQASPRVDAESSAPEFSSSGDHALCLFMGWLARYGSRGRRDSTIMARAFHGLEYQTVPTFQET